MEPTNLPDLQNTGERVIPEKSTRGLSWVNLQRHQAAYLFALRRTPTAARVLDIGCGVGHGSAMLAKHVAKAIGLDNSPEAVAYARPRYAAPNLEFQVGDAGSLGLPDLHFHAAISVQVFEHLPDPERHVTEVARVLRNSGTYIIATPNRHTYPTNENEHHEREYSAEELRDVLSTAFASVEVSGLHAPLELAVRPEVQESEFAVRANAIRPLHPDWLVEEGSETFEWADITARSFPVSGKSLDTSLDLLAYCRKT